MRILVVDDEKNIRRSFSTALESMDHATTCASTSAAALSELRAQSFDVVLLDLKLAHENGLDVLEEIVRIAPQASVVMVTAYASIETAVEAMRRGAFDYLPKPCTPDQVRQVLARSSRQKTGAARCELESRFGANEPESDLTSRSPAMQKLLEIAFKVAESEATVLLLGESGTGKSVLARAIHQRSPDGGRVCHGELPKPLARALGKRIVRALKGSFTGARCGYTRESRGGRWGHVIPRRNRRAAAGDSAEIAAPVTRKEYERVGETKPRRANVRIISATNRELTKAVAEGKVSRRSFLSVERRLNPAAAVARADGRSREDCSQPVGLFARHAGKTIQGFSPEALAAMRQYSGRETSANSET